MISAEAYIAFYLDRGHGVPGDWKEALMQITIETTLPADKYVDPTGHEVCALIDSVREMIRYNMGPERAYNSSGPVYAADGTTLAMWKLEL